MEAIAAMTAIGRSDGSSAIAALFQRDVPVGGLVVVGRELELDPGGREGGAALDAALEGKREGDEGGGVGAEGGCLFRVGEVAAGGAVAVPEVVVEVVGAGGGGLVGEEDAGAAVVVLAGGVCDEAFRGGAVGHAGRGRGGRVAVGVGD